MTTDTTYPLCPLCGRGQAGDICPACCAVDHQLDALVDAIMEDARVKIEQCERLTSLAAPADRDTAELRANLTDLQWALATLRLVRDRIGG